MSTIWTPKPAPSPEERGKQRAGNIEIDIPGSFTENKARLGD